MIRQFLFQKGLSQHMQYISTPFVNNNQYSSATFTSNDLVYKQIISTPDILYG
ncbi:hypothetical protein Hanom_Chr05g00450531 [Helianthus anomalus]